MQISANAAVSVVVVNVTPLGTGELLRPCSTCILQLQHDDYEVLAYVLHLERTQILLCRISVVVLGF